MPGHSERRWAEKLGLKASPTRPGSTPAAPRGGVRPAVEPPVPITEGADARAGTSSRPRSSRAPSVEVLGGYDYLQEELTADVARLRNGRPTPSWSLPPSIKYVLLFALVAIGVVLLVRAIGGHMDGSGGQANGLPLRDQYLLPDNQDAAAGGPPRSAPLPSQQLDAGPGAQAPAAAGWGQPPVVQASSQPDASSPQQPGYPQQSGYVQQSTQPGGSAAAAAGTQQPGAQLMTPQGANSQFGTPQFGLPQVQAPQFQFGTGTSGGAPSGLSTPQNIRRTPQPNPPSTAAQQSQQPGTSGNSGAGASTNGQATLVRGTQPSMQPD